MPAIRTLIQALRELGPSQLGLYALYRFGLRSGHYRRITPPPEASSPGTHPPALRLDLFQFPSRDALARLLEEKADALLAEANEIVSGKFRQFGGPAVPLRLKPDEGLLEHWTVYEQRAEPRREERTGDAGEPEAPEARDIKFVWEPGRFGWAFTLGRAYHLSRDERLAQAFWSYCETFLDANPPYLGPHWRSGQEAALRLMALVWAAQVFATSPCSTPERMALLSEAVAFHAARIPPTLVYARSQHNNHLLTEAAGLYTAGLALPAHPCAGHWRALGWRWLNQGLQAQIAPGGAYAQHSANYQRLLLQTSLWAYSLAETEGREFPDLTRRRLAAATCWLLALLDPVTGRVPNLGPNDGAYIFPFSSLPFEDYRPVLQACSLAFLGVPACGPGLWDEMSLWFGIAPRTEGEGTAPHAEPNPGLDAGRGERPSPHILNGRDSWAYLRAEQFSSRPGHADQLHLDLWWRGLNLAQDAGTYLYNGAPPWDNALAGTAVHNTLMLDGKDQMQRAGRFLWLHWAQARATGFERAPDGSWERLDAVHTGYRDLGVLHSRTVTAFQDGRWLVEDRALPPRPGEKVTGTAHSARVHWLLPDLDWELASEEERLTLWLDTGQGRVELQISTNQGTSRAFSDSALVFQLDRAGERLAGSGAVSPIAGWVSPTYGLRLPALSLSAEIRGGLPLRLVSEWRLPCTSS